MEKHIEAVVGVKGHIKPAEFFNNIFTSGSNTKKEILMTDNDSGEKEMKEEIIF